MTKAENNGTYCQRTARLLAGAAIMLIGTARPVHAQFAPTIELGTIGSPTGLQLRGAAAESSGFSVSSAGDFNGDGQDDVIIGAPNADHAGQNNSGAVYIVYGRSLALPVPLQLSALNGNNGFAIGGKANGVCGLAVAAAGDVNSDGFDDVIIGCGVVTGTAYVVFGRSANGVPSIGVTSLNGASGFQISQQPSDGDFGRAVSGVGDINGDGFNDVAIGARESGGLALQPGRAYVVFGKAAAFSSVVQVSALNGKTGFRIDGGANGLRVGNSVSAAGDVNGDGIDDLITGSYPEGPNNDLKKGRSFVVYGKAGKFPPAINTSSLKGSNGFMITGVEDFDLAGFSAAGGGDVNGDGHADVVLGTSLQSPNSGGAYVLFGKSGAFSADVQLSTLDGSNGYLMSTQIPVTGSGTAVALPGDLDGDGFDDIAYGNAAAGYSGIDGGLTYVHFGRFGGHAAEEDASSFTGADGFRADGVSTGNQSGKSVAGAGDFNGDGFDDLIIGAPSFNSGAGASYILFGRAPIVSEIRAGAAGSQTIRGGPFSDMLFGVGGNDVLEGRGSGDLLDGSAGTNTASYEFAPVGVIANLNSPSQNTGDAEGDSYTLIQGLLGSRFDDTLTGDAKANRITGGRGRDVLKGRKGKDRFSYRKFNESLAGAVNRDEIVDFNPGTASSMVDQIDVSGIDARSGKNGNQKFKFIGTKPFTGAGQLRLKKSGNNLILQANTGGSKAPEFEIVLKGLKKPGKFTAKDFKL